MMLGVLLARAGVPVTVLEKHCDFLRDFRGDTVHPSTLAILDAIGLRARFDALPQDRVGHLSAVVAGYRQQFIDFRGLKPYDYLALVPQWHFLDMLAGAGREYPHFDLRMRHEATGLIRCGGRVAGVEVTGPDGARELHASLVVACDGRGSTIRAATDLPVRRHGAPMDVLWFRMPRTESDLKDTFGIIDHGHMMVLLNRGDYWQVAFLVPKGSDVVLRGRPVEALRETVVQLAPFFADRKRAIGSWDDVRTLSVQVDRLERWHTPGLLLIGDAAHAMSPIGGVGINLAIQDAVAAANALAGPLRDGGVIDEALLAAVQRRREWPVKVVQCAQLAIQNRLISRVLEGCATSPRIPVLLRGLLHLRAVRHIPARLFGYGLRQERVRTPAITPVD